MALLGSVAVAVAVAVACAVAVAAVVVADTSGSFWEPPRGSQRLWEPLGASGGTQATSITIVVPRQPQSRPLDGLLRPPGRPSGPTASPWTPSCGTQDAPRTPPGGT